MLGDQAKAQQLVNDLKTQAAKTPFGMGDLAGSMQTLLAFGISLEDAKKHLMQIGDISQGDAQKMESLTLAFAQMSSTGKLTGQDLNQMINAGFNPLEEISRTTGKSIGELKEEMAKGAISADMVADAFASATEEGGRFHGGDGSPVENLHRPAIDHARRHRQPQGPARPRFDRRAGWHGHADGQRVDR
nr:tape measure protein [Dermabacter hominis]